MEKYTSTLLPQDNTPQENQKAVLDLLKKTNQVHDDATSGIAAAKAELQKQINTANKLRAYVCAEGNGATAANTAINFAETLDTDGLYASGVITAPKDGVVYINACAVVVSEASILWIGKNANSTYLYLQTVARNQAGSGSMIVPAIAGDSFYITSSSGVAANAYTSLGIEFIEL